MMGRGTITGGGTDGLYTIAIDFGKATRDARVAKMDERISVLNIEIAAAEASVAAAESAASAALSALSAAINAMADALEEGGPEAAALATVAVKRAEEEVAKATSAELAARAPRDQRIFERTSLVDRKRALLAAKVEDTRQAWCVDLTEDATGEVATIEIPGEDQAILIAAGGRAPEDGDGALMARELMTPEQVFWNAAVLPGWQKWKPSYRKATITAIDEEAGTVDVDLDPATSSAKRLNVNQAEALAGVEVVYMDCNADAFDVDDRVVVEFDGMTWDSPKVIGFVENPKPCTWVYVGDGIGARLACLRPGLIDQIIAGGVGQVWLNGSGPYTLEQSISVPLYSGGTTTILPPGYWSIIFWEWRGPDNNLLPDRRDGESGFEFERPLLTIQFLMTAPADVSGGELSSPYFVNGYSRTSVSSVLDGFIEYPPPLAEYPHKNIVEVRITVGGEKVLHFAYSSIGFIGQPDYGVIYYKGVPARLLPGVSNTFARLDNYYFRGE